jgi:type II secretory pathway pseudopilin PulG
VHRRTSNLLAFTLIELLVSLAVITLALAAVGVVFTTTTQAAGAATAMQELDAWLRQFADELKADLDGIDPTTSALVIVGRTQAAGLTDEDRLAGRYYRLPVGWVDPDASFDPETDTPVDPETDGYSDPRADILMFITQRPIKSQVPPTDLNLGGTYEDLRTRLASDQRHSPAVVVYGHASYDGANADGDDFADEFLHITEGGLDSKFDEISAIPAVDWLLARRATILSEEPLRGGDQLRLDEIDDGDRILRMWIDESSAADRDRGADVASFSWPQFLTNPDLPGCALESPYDDSWVGRCGSDIRDVLIDELLYAGNASDVDYHVATVIKDPPLALGSNLSLQALPHCVWFQVEFLMPEDARNHLDYDSPNLPDPDNDYQSFMGDSGGVVSNVQTRFDMPLWTSVDPDPSGSPVNTNTYVFLPDSQAARDQLRRSSRWDDFSEIDQDESKGDLLADPNSADPKRIRLFPYGLRITVRVTDPQGRLAEPLERVIEHYFE